MPGPFSYLAKRERTSNSKKKKIQNNKERECAREKTKRKPRKEKNYRRVSGTFS